MLMFDSKEFTICHIYWDDYIIIVTVYTHEYILFRISLHNTEHLIVNAESNSCYSVKYGFNIQQVFWGLCHRELLVYIL